MRDYIDAAAFKEMILCADEALYANTQMINDLNVFPVPDGDTGTNMGLTLSNAASELRKKSFDSISDTADCVASALLRGARGNSGVILSLLFRGIYKKLKGLETADAKQFADAMQKGVESAYKAVMKPAEGTILTVSRLASAAFAEAAAAGASLESCFVCAMKAGEEALADTVNQNPVLKKAGVVDAGGKGYMIILGAMLASLRGEVSASGDMGSRDYSESENSGLVGVDGDHITFTFDTVFTVVKKEVEQDFSAFRAYLDSIGDSLVMNEDDEILKVHVHTDIPGEVLSEAQKYGTLELAKIENMVLQYEAASKGQKGRDTDDLASVEKELEKSAAQPASAEPAIAEPEKEYGIVAVCAGEGMESLFRELGADAVVTGGQTMNPSTDDILKAVNATPASTVFVFPNNKNIIMAAEQCRRFTEKTVVVIPSKTIPQGVTALLNFSPDESVEQLTETMAEAMKQVHTAQVTYAARDSDFDGHNIHAGEYLALLDGALQGSYTNIKTLIKELSWSFDEFSPEFITVYYGEDVDEAAANEAAATIGGVFPDAEVSVVAGGQPVYYYIISVE